MIIIIDANIKNNKFPKIIKQYRLFCIILTAIFGPKSCMGYKSQRSRKTYHAL